MANIDGLIGWDVILVNGEANKTGVVCFIRIFQQKFHY